jgi:thymidylate synthase (FAD)
MIPTVTTQKPKVSLISFTSEPLLLMCWARRVMHFPVPDTLEELKVDPEKWLGTSLEDYVNNTLLQDGMPTFLEYPSLTFKLENVSRALTHQLVRHRIGFSYSQQSMRCVSAQEFASKGLYYMPDTIADKQAYHNKMLAIQDAYNNALNSGVSVQDARGLLPTNIYTTITFNATLRAFIGMINKRLCSKTQGEFREVARLMTEEVYNKIDKRLSKWIGAPCQVQGYCMMAGENNEQYKKGLLTGSQNTACCCPNYISKFVKKDG